MLVYTSCICSLRSCTYVMRRTVSDGLPRNYLYEMNGYDMDSYERLENSIWHVS